MVAVQRVRDKQPAEKEDFCHQKDPNAQLAGVELLFGRIKVMGNELTMIVMIIVRRM